MRPLLAPPLPPPCPRHRRCYHYRVFPHQIGGKCFVISHFSRKIWELTKQFPPSTDGYAADATLAFAFLIEKRGDDK